MTWFMQGYETLTLTLLRIVAGLMFAQHGTQKLFGMFGGQAAPLASMFGVAGVLETIGGLLIAIGLLTRPVAFILSGEMAVAYFTAHLPRGIWPVQNGGEPAVLYSFLWLYFSARGAGPYSVDALIGDSAAADQRRAPVAPRRT